MVSAIRDPNLLESETCDWWIETEGEYCGESPAGYVGGIYYSCEDHVMCRADWLEED